MASHPYRELDDLHFWSRSVTGTAFHELDPVREVGFRISPDDRIATIGSCFAQNLSRFLQGIGMNYFVVESGAPGMSERDRARHNYGTFSARYGNVYTARQAVQLIERAYGRWPAEEEVWRKGETYVDSLRPQIEPEGFASDAELRRDRSAHLSAVQQVVEQADVLVFTLGLTEAWRTRATGLVLPVVPGASGGTFDDAIYEFVNFTVQEVVTDLHAFVGAVRHLNPRCRLVLTVSPVPLIATYTDQHVLPATTYSKSVLRVAAAEIAGSFDRVDYFPSYEIVTNPSAADHYFADDLRSVTDAGVEHVMRVFVRHYVHGEVGRPTRTVRDSLASEIEQVRRVICDEEVLDQD